MYAFASLLKDPEAEVRAATSNRLKGKTQHVVISRAALIKYSYIPGLSKLACHSLSLPLSIIDHHDTLTHCTIGDFNEALNVSF